MLKNIPVFSVVLWASLFANSLVLRATEKVEIEFVGTARIPGDARDLSGDAALLENGEPRNRLGGFSALDYLVVPEKLTLPAGVGLGRWIWVVKIAGKGIF